MWLQAGMGQSRELQAEWQHKYMSLQGESAIMKHELDDVSRSLPPHIAHLRAPESFLEVRFSLGDPDEGECKLSYLLMHCPCWSIRCETEYQLLQAQASLREERCSGAALQQQLAQLQEAGQARAQSVMRLEAQLTQLATQLQHSQGTSHTLQKLIQVTHTHLHRLG